MTTSVIAVFDSFQQAQEAVAALSADGFAPGAIRTSPEADTPDARQRALDSLNRDATESSIWSIGEMFRALFFGASMNDADQHKNQYAEAIRRGSVLVTVDADDARHDRAVEVLQRFSPVDLDERATQWTNAGWGGYRHDAPPLSAEEIERERASDRLRSSSQGAAAATTPPAQTSTGATAPTGETAIPVVQEELKVGKRVVQRGGVRLFRRVHEQPVEETITLREERVLVERRPVDAPAGATSPDSLPASSESIIELREIGEEPVIEKTARVVEEVVIGKEVSERTETVRDTVRRTDVEVQPMAGDPQGSVAGATTSAGRQPFSASSIETSDAASDYRQHWQSISPHNGPFEDYLPAYQYGATLAGDARYQGQDWAAIESHARSGWEASHGGQLWDRFKDAVQHGWQRVAH